jgi:hypothetical protein
MSDFFEGRPDHRRRPTRKRLATLEDIAAVPGFGGKAAQSWQDFLQAGTATPTKVGVQPDS